VTAATELRYLHVTDFGRVWSGKEELMAHTESAGLRITFDDFGYVQPALLFLPGWCEPRTVFEHLAPQCAVDRRVLVLDWRGHGDSEVAAEDFGLDALVEDALAVIEASHVESFIPVSVSHAGWVSIELRRRLGEQVKKLIFLDWFVLDPPPPFLDVLAGLQDPQRWKETRDRLFETWIADSDDEAVAAHIREEMGAFDADMWARAARSIAAAYKAAGNPLKALGTLPPPVPTLHLYSQPADPQYLAAQQAFAKDHPWFRVQRLEARSHFPALENPDEVAECIRRFEL
jgi:pimeloyl-ACP methyl ester carboxylesterase